MTDRKISFLFPGQGSQYMGMGKEFYDTVPEAAEIFAAAQAVTGIPVRDLCFEGPAEELVKTANLQPCLTTVEIICAFAARAGGMEPCAVAGHSLGEYPALWCAGVLDTETAVYLVWQRGRLMDEAAALHPGAMAAVIGIPSADLEKLVQECRGHGQVLGLANYNSPEQIVVTGEKQPVATLCRMVRERKARAIPLKVSGGYHSPLMKQAAGTFAGILEDVTFNMPLIPVYSNVTGKAETDPARIRELMVEQICSPVRWVDVVNNMADQGVKAFVEAGPKRVLTNLAGKCLQDRQVKLCQFDTPDALEECRQSVLEGNLST